MNKSDIDELFEKTKNKTKNKDETAKISSAVQGKEDETVKSKVERLEEFPRKDNLRMFGIPHSWDSSFEDYDT